MTDEEIKLILIESYITEDLLDNVIKMFKTNKSGLLQKTDKLLASKEDLEKKISEQETIDKINLI